MKRKSLLRVVAVVAMTWQGGVTASAQEREAYAALSDDGQTVTFYYDDQKKSRWGVKINSSFDKNPYASITTAVFDASFADYQPTSTAYWFSDCSHLTAISGMENLNTENVTDMRRMFYGCSSLTSLDVSGFNTANVTDMDAMFEGCNSLTSLDVSGFNTENVTDMGGMFWGCKSLTSLDLSGFNTEKVTYMGGMFQGCSALTSLDVSGFNTANVTNMQWMFDTCSLLTSLDLSGFNTANVTDMGWMFYGCNSLTSLDVSGFNTANVMTMKRMFCYCYALTSLDVSGFNTANVTDMKRMFYDCRSLKTIYADETKWSTAAVTSSDYMFTGCIAPLVGGNGTEYDENHINAEYARVDKEDQPGYFTQKSATGIRQAKAQSNDGNGAWYTLGGQRVTGEPAQKGIYVNGGRKVVRK